MDKNEIIQYENRLLEAIKAGDVVTLDKLLYDELLFISPGGQSITKQMDLASHRSGNMKVERLTPTFEEVRITGDNAIVVVVYDTRGTMLGNPIEGRFRYIRIWKQFDNGLKVIGGSCCQI